jgi:hypothetical protein
MLPSSLPLEKKRVVGHVSITSKAIRLDVDDIIKIGYKSTIL